MIENKLDRDNVSGLTVVLKYIILLLICLMAFSIRLFAVVRWESVIHEFDPHFNFRTTKFLAREGPMNFLNWFDDRSWYPLGRIVGGTIYPGLMATAAFMHWILNWFHVSMNVRNMCVMTAPIFSANTAIATYLLVKEASKRSSTGLIAAALVAIVPAYISRSVGGSYDNEGVAIFALIFTFYLWVKAVNTGSMLWALFCAIAYFYMVAAWGGYVFIINIIPIYVVVMLLYGRWSSRLYVAYCTFYIIGSLLAMQVPFVGFNVIRQAECAASHGVFILCNGYVLMNFIKSKITVDAFNSLIRNIFLAAVGSVAIALIWLQITGKMEWTGRSLTLLDPTYASKYIPIIASVSEHQPTSWSSFFFDLHIVTPLAPVGLFFLFDEITDGKIFIILYGTIAWYFAGVMIRLMLTLAPIACILAGFGISAFLRTMSGSLKTSTEEEETEKAHDKNNNTNSSSNNKKRKGETTPRSGLSAPLSLTALLGGLAFLVMYVLHGTFVASEAYSSPSVVLGSKRADGSKHIIDDFREAYYWLRQNTEEDARIMSWWDYGYQLSSMSNRTVLVDNNTWNNTHIATVGRAMASSEEDAYPILQSLDVDYVLAVFGGAARYSSDDINKFLWMIRIAQGVYPDDVSESSFFGRSGYKTDSSASSTMLNSLMYKISYYRFGEKQVDYSKPKGYDMVRNAEIGRKNFQLKHLEEAYTTEHWIVRIYKVKKPENVDPTPDGASIDSLRRHHQGGEDDQSVGVGGTDVKTRFIGCYGGERFFSNDKEYHGSAAGANFNLIKYAAVSNQKNYFAVARAVTDGHGFVFNRLLSQPDVNANEAGCQRRCLDDDTKPCGCVDGLCQAPIPPGEEHNRRWAVYEVLSDTTPKKPKKKKK